MRIHHDLAANIHASATEVWALAGNFGNMSWHPTVTSCTIVDGAAQTPGAIREIHLQDGSRILERLVELDRQGRSFTYSFVGTPPIPVSASHTSVTVTALPARPHARTRIAWHGEFEVAGHAAQATVEHVNCQIVWPSTVDALASTLGVEYSFDVPSQGNTKGNVTS
ncbi:SRPBCC family protein [Rhodococcus sp. ACS1]|uniref:SRPBCC family protein n=1 Tax=Rhodococcus sp. ACS1 TaxID=2028570 RepID=UPI0015C8C178|nr:SRPBCC family protein [Rhodococcus sp. ACS1]